MSLEDQRHTLAKLIAEIHTLRADATLTTSSTTFVSWKARVTSTLTRTLGAQHHITAGFLGYKWSSVYEEANKTLARGFDRSLGFLDAAVDEVALLASASNETDAAWIDSELWEHIAAHVAAEDWSTVASQTAIFTEDRIRRWTGQPPVNVGEKLMTAALGESGGYRLGLTTGEKNGWHRFGMGISMALRNADAHRIQTRNDHRLYAMGVVGASSLLLTQLRHEHGNRFQDVGPVSLDLTTGDAQ